MDTGRGNFEKIKTYNEKAQEAAIAKLKEEYPNHGGVFKTGEQIKLKDSLFKVHAIKPNKLILKLLKKTIIQKAWVADENENI